MSPAGAWPEAPVKGWLDTCATLQMRTQIVGKVRLARAPVQNHWWQVPLYVTASGLTTSPIPDGNRTFQIDFDLIGHELRIATSDGMAEALPLRSQPLPAFHAELFARLRRLGIDVEIWPVPVEVADAVPFTEDSGHSAYDPEIAGRLHEILVLADMALAEFRSGFVGKCSPVHFFWGGFDLAVTRFSGREAPPHPGGIPNVGDWVMVEAYSHELSSCGFWPGTLGGNERPAFYCYAYPEPTGFSAAPVRPGEAFYSANLREFLLPYDAVRRSPEPQTLVREFLQSTYEAAANRGKWDRNILERAGS